jgi:hypothetical protein
MPSGRAVAPDPARVCIGGTASKSAKVRTEAFAISAFAGPIEHTLITAPAIPNPRSVHIVFIFMFDFANHVVHVLLARRSSVLY